MSLDGSNKGSNKGSDGNDGDDGISWFTSLKYKTGLGTLSEKDKVEYEFKKNNEKKLKDCQACYEYRDWMLSYSPTVRFMIEQIDKVAKNSNEKFSSQKIVCEECNDNTKGGGFHPELGILICQDKILDKWHLEDTLSHELIHYYDNLKFKVDWFNLKHHACSEIRASSLSGECRIMAQFWRAAIKNFSRGHQACVKRRAILSVQANPNCHGKEEAEKIVNEVWESCFNDTRPFEEIYR
ncbi:hypothetical protein PACTADRAFT_51408 [Pachysolen tannophilus NRRL Y-2460]|uniref:Mitochondrial inner membrane protease ATP23 n=1 Tax=Pachysolen tannophilus NRRL Y-2460 TaxID=669874 RepID=A0A1E4TPJ2_PACTA|nr:hypothetical protein PACTADRAFT_51408 [Pachysolen tannophilus NRRL Y-2460]